MSASAPNCDVDGGCQVRNRAVAGWDCAAKHCTLASLRNGISVPTANPGGSACTPAGTATPMGGWLACLHLAANHRGLRKLWLRVRAAAVLLTLGLSLPFLRGDWLWAAFGVALAGEMLQLWCFANLAKNSSICAQGPYALVRNPMYLGRYFVVAGFLLLYQNPYVILGMTVVYCIYAYNRVRREEAFLLGVFQDDYLAYCRQVNRFRPSWRPLPGSRVATWQWRLLRRNNGLHNLLGLLATCALAAWVAHHQPIWQYPW